MKDYFSKVEDIDLNKFTLGVYMIYGWMPRALRFNGGELIREEEFIRLKAKLLEMKGWDEKRFLKVVSADDGDAGQKSVDKENALPLVEEGDERLDRWHVKAPAFHQSQNLPHL